MCGAAGMFFGVLFGNGMQTETQLELMQSSFSSMVCKIFYVSPFKFHPFRGPLALTQGFEATRTLFHPTHTCTNPDCPKRHAESLLRRKDDPRKVVLFTLSEGACPTYSIHRYLYITGSFRSPTEQGVAWPIHFCAWLLLVHPNRSFPCHNLWLPHTGSAFLVPLLLWFYRSIFKCGDPAASGLWPMVYSSIVRGLMAMIQLGADKDSCLLDASKVYGRSPGLCQVFVLNGELINSVTDIF